MDRQPVYCYALGGVGTIVGLAAFRLAYHASIEEATSEVTRTSSAGSPPPAKSGDPTTTASVTVRYQAPISDLSSITKTTTAPLFSIAIFFCGFAVLLLGFKKEKPTINADDSIWATLFWFLPGLLLIFTSAALMAALALR